MKSVLYSILVFCAATLTAAELRVENRTPQLDEIGYRPADHSTALFNPPSLAWVHEKPADKYIVQWARESTFQTPTTVSNLNFNCYTHNAPLERGEYFWRYKFVSSKNEESDWSLVRHFTISDGAIEFPMPAAEERRKRIPGQHPRLFLRPEELPRLRELAAGTHRDHFNELRHAADKLLAQPLVSEPDKMGSARDKKNLDLIALWWPNREQAVRACTEAETMAFVYLITGEKKYGDAARQRILNLASWNPDGPTNFRLNCEAAKPLLHRLSRAYDWAYDALSPEDRKVVQAAVKRRIQDAWQSGEVGRGVGHINRPLNSHGNRTWHKIGESALVFLDEIPEADLWLDYALNKFYTCYPVWSDEDGGWHEGTAYLGSYMVKSVWWLQAMQSALKIDGFKKPFFAQVGDFPLYMAPPGSPNIGFGDLSYRSTLQGWGGFMEFFIRNVAHRVPNSHAPQWRWWIDQWQMEGERGVLGFLYNASLPPLPETKPPIEFPQSKVFRGVGIASLHTSLLNSSNDVHFLFKSSPFGAQSHGHNPQNSFQLNAYGESLLATCVYRDLYGSDFHYRWAHQTVAHNAVLVNGLGQLSHSARSLGKIADFQLTPEWDYVCGDAKEAYEGRLQRALRHVVFVKPDVFVIYDDLAAPESAEFQFMLHSMVKFSVDKKNTELRVQQPNAGVIVRYLSQQPLTFRQTDGFPYKPIRGSLPDQWHVEAAPKRKLSELGMLTVLLPYRGTKKPQASIKRLESDSAIGAAVSLGAKTVTIAFRKSGTTGQAQLEGMHFVTPTAVHKSATKTD